MKTNLLKEMCIKPTFQITFGRNEKYIAIGQSNVDDCI